MRITTEDRSEWYRLRDPKTHKAPHDLDLDALEAKLNRRLDWLQEELRSQLRFMARSVGQRTRADRPKFGRSLISGLSYVAAQRDATARARAIMDAI